MPRFNPQTKSALHAGEIEVSTHELPLALYAFDERKGFLVIGSIPPKSRIKVVPGKAPTDSEFPFVYVQVQGREAQEGLIPKSLLHDYALGTTSGGLYTGIAYGGSKWFGAFDNYSQRPLSKDDPVNIETLLKEEAKEKNKTLFATQHRRNFVFANPEMKAHMLVGSACQGCGRKANDHKVYETLEASYLAFSVIHHLRTRNWNPSASKNSKQAAMIGIAKTSDCEVLVAHSGEKDVPNFAGLIQELNSPLMRSIFPIYVKTWIPVKAFTPMEAVNGNRQSIQNTVKSKRFFNGKFEQDHVKCAAPKLLQHANMNQMELISISEKWYVRPTVSSDVPVDGHQLYDTVEPCENCRRILPLMMCHMKLGGIEVDGKSRNVYSGLLRAKGFTG